MRNPKFYWLIGIVTILVLGIVYSIVDAVGRDDNSPEVIETSQLVDSRMAIIDKNATARSIIKNMLIDKTTKITVISGTMHALSDYVLAYSNDKKHRGYLDLSHLTPKSEGSYVLWSKSPSGKYNRVRVFPPKSEFLQYDVPPKDHTMLITLEPAGAGSQPNLTSIIAEEQIEN